MAKEAPSATSMFSAVDSAARSSRAPDPAIPTPDSFPKPYPGRASPSMRAYSRSSRRRCRNRLRSMSSGLTLGASVRSKCSASPASCTEQRSLGSHRRTPLSCDESSEEGVGSRGEQSVGYLVEVHRPSAIRPELGLGAEPEQSLGVQRLHP